MNVHQRLALATAAVALGAGLAGTTQAQAQGQGQAHTRTHPSAVSVKAASQRRDVCFSGACGSATLTFQSHYCAKVSMSVADNRCDTHPAKVRILADQYHLGTGSRYTWHGPWHVNHRGCHGGTGPAWNSTFAGGVLITAPSPAVATTGSPVRPAQTDVNGLAHNAGAADGITGARTRAATEPTTSVTASPDRPP
ncbi:hypothetical protein [Streptomyces sp. NPDC052036]|uniref:hypothetical protein n=1 Tax=Streptomyces sp. NPDC052036 TaxID=3155171 RepID=UPI0034480514